jgi:hypothetical protein
MDIAHPICSTISSVSFSFLTTDDVRRISVKQITNPVQFDSLNQPNIGGLYDPALGPTTHRDMYVPLLFPSHPLVAYFSSDVQHVDWVTFHAPATLAISNSLFPYITHYS